MSATPLTLSSIPLAAVISDDSSLRQSILDVVATFGCMKENAEIKAFFSNASNIVGIKSAFNKYGLPPKNRASYHTGAAMFGKWHDFCDSDLGMFKFYYAAKYRQQYQIPAAVPANCQQIATMQVGVNAELVTSDKLYVTDGNSTTHLYRTQALNDILTDLSSMYSNMSCDMAIQQQQQALIAAQTAAAEAASQAALLNTYQVTNSIASGGTSNIAIYAVAGVGVLITIMVMVKVLKS